ncbi:hypothetical protein T484DRAFT_1778005, partial [Baffinella frigidus]
ASSAWWNYRHYLHHAKKIPEADTDIINMPYVFIPEPLLPNISEADPDINMPYVFMMGEKMAAKWAKKQRMFSTVAKAQTTEPWMWKMEYLHHEQRPLYFGEWF